jgi:hypothetical protein
MVSAQPPSDLRLRSTLWEAPRSLAPMFLRGGGVAAAGFRQAQPPGFDTVSRIARRTVNHQGGRGLAVETRHYLSVV